jgi:hypothetical protein
MTPTSVLLSVLVFSLLAAVGLVALAFLGDNNGNH